MPKRILAADHSQTMRQALQYTFAQESEFALTLVSQGQAVLDALGREPFDLLLLDHRLPNISGADICLRCKQTPQTAHIPVLLLIGQNTDPGQFSLTGCQGVIRKPFLTSDLLERVAELLHVSIKPLPPTLSSSPKMLERTEIAIEIDVEGASSPPANTSPAISPATPFASSLPTARSSAPLSPSGADLFSVPSARPVSQTNLVPPPLPKMTPGSPRTPLHPGLAAKETGFPLPLEPAKAPTLQAPTDMMIDDLPYEISGPGASVVRETPAPQPAPNHLFFPVSDVISSMAPPTTPFVPDYSQEPFSSPPSFPSQAQAFPTSSLTPPGLHHNPGLPMTNLSYLGTPDESTLSSLSPASGSALGTSTSSVLGSSPGSLLNKPLPPPSFSSQRETKPVALQNLPAPTASSASSAPPLGGNVPSQDSMDVLIGSPVELGASGAEQAKELLLPLEDEPQAPISSSPTPHRSMKAVGDYADALRNPLLTSTGFLDSRPTPRIDHLEQTAVVPAIRRQMGQATQIPLQVPSRSPLAALESDSPRVSPVSMPTPRSKASLPSMDLSTCPPQHCQLTLGSVLPLHTVAMFLQFVDYAQSRLQSSLKNEQTTPVLVSFQTKENTSVFTFSGSYAFLRCLMPTLLECCGNLREEERQAVAESFLAGAAEEVKTQLRRACLQARISSRPYAMALSQEIPELGRTTILKLESSLDDGPMTHHQGSPNAQRPSEEQAYIPAKLKLRDLLLRHFTMHSLNRFMEEEFSLPLHDMIPLNLSTQSVFFAVIHHFEQRYQLPELAEAIREKHPSFPVQPFEDFPDL